MEEGIHIDDYISDMLISREWGRHTEIVAFSEIYNTSVLVFDSLASEEPVIKIGTQILLMKLRYCFLKVIMTVY